MQQGYFDQCNDIISNLEDKLSKIQLIVDDLSVFAFGNTQIKAVGVSDAKQLTGTPVPSSKLQNRMIDAGEHANLIIDELTRLSLFLLGKQEDDWKDDLAFTDSAEAQTSPVKQAKPETLEAVEVARKTVGAKNVIVIGGHEVPAPMSCEPTLKQIYYVPDDFRCRYYFASTWDGNEIDFDRLRKGMCHATKEAAIAHAKALIAVSKGE